MRSQNLGGRVVRRTSFAGIAAAVALSSAATSCGGGGGFAAKSMSLIAFHLSDRALVPTFPTNVQALPRNALLVFEFSEIVDPSSVNDQTIQVRTGAQFQSVPKGQFQVDGSRVIFDPTVTQQGTPNPLGFAAVAQFIVDLPAVEDQDAVVRNLDSDPLLTPFLTRFTTSAGFLNELNPPEIESLVWTPLPDPVTRQIPGNGFFTLTFSEAIDPGSMVPSITNPAPVPTDTIEARYLNLTPNPNVNNPSPLPLGGVELTTISGQFQPDPSLKKWAFLPTFGFGGPTIKWEFAVSVFQGVRDLAGNLLINPRSFGPFKADGTASAAGRILFESFDNQVDNDAAATPGNSGDWGSTTPGTLVGATISTRRVRIPGYRFAEQFQGGQYSPVAEPLTGANLAAALQAAGLPPPNPPTVDGRRVMFSYTDREIGQPGTVTTASWGPDSNATFAAQYPEVVLQIGFQKTASISLASTFDGNWLGNPVIYFKGVYNVAQKANVGNEEPITRPTHSFTRITAVTPTTVTLGGNPNYGCYTSYAPPPIGTAANPPPLSLINMMDCLYVYTGYVNWPDPTSFFDWEDGDPLVDEDRILVWDASAKEGNTWQQYRLWYANTTPNSGVPISGFPLRRMYSTHEANDPNPPDNVAAGIKNPEWSVQDNAFTLTRRVSFATVKFYSPSNGDPALNPAPSSFPLLPASNFLSTQVTFGVDSDYMDPILFPTVQPGGATILVEFRGCTALDPTGQRNKINAAFPFTPFTTDVDDCDTFPYIQWRITLVANLLSQKSAQVTIIGIPVQDLVP